jgi:hypothetical protein
MSPLFNFSSSLSGQYPAITSGTVYINNNNVFQGPYAITSGNLSVNSASDDAFSFSNTLKLIPASNNFTATAFDFTKENVNNLLTMDFQLPTSSGFDLNAIGETFLNNINFETADSLNNFTISGLGSITSSGRLTPGLLGSFSLGISGTSDARLYVETNVAGASGIKIGRSSWLHKMPLTANSTSALLFAFAQDIDLNTYAVRIKRNNSNMHSIDFVKQPYYQAYSGSPLQFSNAFTNDSLRLIYTNSTSASDQALRWWGLDWEYRDTDVGLPVIVTTLYSKPYEIGDTLDTFKNKAYQIIQSAIYTPSGTSNWNTFNNSFKPSFILVDDNSSSDATLVDNISLEKFTENKPTSGLHSSKIVYDNSNIANASHLDLNTNFTSFAAIINPNVGSYTTSGSVEGNLFQPLWDSVISNPIIRHYNFLNDSSKDYFNVPVKGFLGHASIATSSTFRQLRYYIKNSENVTHGAVRILFRNLANFGSGADTPDRKQFELVINRTGTITNNSCYKFTIHSFGSNIFVTRLYKHTSPTTVSNLITSSNVTVGPYEYPEWLEFRWKVNSNSTLVEFEVLRASADISGITFDSPLSIYPNFTSLMTYTDSSSPLVNAPEPIAIMLSAEDFKGPRINWIGVRKNG